MRDGILTDDCKTLGCIWMHRMSVHAARDLDLTATWIHQE